MKKIFSPMAIAATTLFLVACNHPDFVKVGEPYQQVMKQLGLPDSQTNLPDGSIRVVYSEQPKSPHVYELIFGPDGTLIKKEEILYDKFFMQNIKPNEMDQADIDRLFGRPAVKRNFRISGIHSYMYRYEAGGLPWALWVDFDNKTNKVLGWTISIDPWSQKGGGDNKK